MQIQNYEIEKIIPYSKNPREISEKAIDSVAHSIKEFGWQQPIVTDKKLVVIVGHTRLLAAKRLGLKEVPVKIENNLSEEKVKAYRILDNRLNELSGWDEDLLNIELSELENADESIKELLQILEKDKLDIDESAFLNDIANQDVPDEKQNHDLENYASISFVMLPEDKKMILSKLKNIMENNDLSTSTQALLKIMKEI